MPAFEIPPSFKRIFDKKEPQLKAAILACIQQLSENPRHPGLNVHRVRGTAAVWEAYVDRGNRVTFEYKPDGTIVMRNNCNHDILNRRP